MVLMRIEQFQILEVAEVTKLRILQLSSQLMIASLKDRQLLLMTPALLQQPLS